MSRPRKMTTEQMTAVVDSYYLTRAEGNEKRMKCSLIAAYAAELGYQAEGYDFARNDEVREHIERLKVLAEVQGEETTAVTAYKNLDVEGFLRNNKGHIQLLKALTELDTYWKKVSDYAALTAKTNQKLMKAKTEYEANLKSEIMSYEKLSEEKSELSKRNNKLASENRYLRKMLRIYLYPAVADEILSRENVLKGTDVRVTEIAAGDMTEFDLPKSLRESVAGDMKIQSEDEQLLAKMWGMCDEHF